MLQHDKVEPASHSTNKRHPIAFVLSMYGILQASLATRGYGVEPFLSVREKLPPRNLDAVNTTRCDGSNRESDREKDVMVEGDSE